MNRKADLGIGRGFKGLNGSAGLLGKALRDKGIGDGEGAAASF
jgi:hypothetical protein